MHFALPQDSPNTQRRISQNERAGAIGLIFLFVATIVTAVSFKNFLSLPPALGDDVGPWLLGSAWLTF